MSVLRNLLYYTYFNYSVRAKMVCKSEKSTDGKKVYTNTLHIGNRVRTKSTTLFNYSSKG